MINSCDKCEFYAPPECKRYPPDRNGYPVTNRGCGEYRDVIICPVEPKKEEKAEESPKVSKWTCDICGQECASALGLGAHKRKHR